MISKPIVWIALLALTTPLLASDFEKEERWREQVEDSIMDGESVDLVVEGRNVFAIYTEAEEGSDKGLIVVHGTGIHPNWQQVVQPIRVEMAGYGWNTLALQMPILHNEAEYEEYVALYPEVPPRLRAEDRTRSRCRWHRSGCRSHRSSCQPARLLPPCLPARAEMQPPPVLSSRGLSHCHARCRLRR